MKWLKEVQKGCSVKYLFYFLCGLQGNWNSSKANLAVYFLVWPQAGPRRFSYHVCNRGVLNRDFSADSGTQSAQCLRIYLLSFNTVRQGNWNSSKANLAVYFLVWPQAGPRRFSYHVCNRGVLNRDFSADSGTQSAQCLRIYLLSFNTVRQGGHVFL